MKWCSVLFCDFRVFGRLNTEFLLLKSWNAVAEFFHTIVYNVYVPELRYKMSMTQILSGVAECVFKLADWEANQQIRKAGNTSALTGADLGGGCRGAHLPPSPSEMTCGFVIQLVFCKKKTMWFDVEVEQGTSAPPPNKNPGSAPV